MNDVLNPYIPLAVSQSDGKTYFVHNGKNFASLDDFWFLHPELKPGQQFPIRFNSEFLPVIKDGIKTVTRRVVKTQPEIGNEPLQSIVSEGIKGFGVYFYKSGNPDEGLVHFAPYPYDCVIGDIMNLPDGIKIKIKDIRVEGLNAITDEDLRMEGIDFTEMVRFNEDGFSKVDFINHFAKVWDNLYPMYPWDMNPFVWVIDFNHVRLNW